MVDTPSLEARLRCLGTLLQQLNAQTACAAVNEAIERLATLAPEASGADYVLVPRMDAARIAEYTLDAMTPGDSPGAELSARRVLALLANPAPPTSGEGDNVHGKERDNQRQPQGTTSGGSPDYSRSSHSHTPADESGACALCGDAKTYEIEGAIVDCACTQGFPATPQPRAAAQEELRLFDSQWVNIVNHANCYAGWGMDEAIAHAVKLTEQKMAENARLQPAGEAEDAARLDFIERTFSGMTNRERYLPVQMIWGKGCNGRTLREACDKYMKRDAAFLAANGGCNGNV